MKSIVPFVAAFTLVVGCSDQQRLIPIGDGYALIVRGGEPLLHAAGNLQLVHVQSNKPSLVWNYVVGDPSVTNGTVLFNGGLSDSDSWKHSPAILLHSGKNPVVEITEPLTRLYCERFGVDYSSISNQITFIWPKVTNGAFHVTGEINIPVNDPMRWITMTLSTNEVQQLLLRVLKNGSKVRYRESWCLKE